MCHSNIDWPRKCSCSSITYHGGITVMNLNVLYQPFRHMGFGLGYTGLFLNFSATSSGLGSFQGKRPRRATKSATSSCALRAPNSSSSDGKVEAVFDEVK
jgi:hypothetical protein